MKNGAVVAYSPDTIKKTALEASGNSSEPPRHISGNAKMHKASTTAPIKNRASLKKIVALGFMKILDIVFRDSSKNLEFFNF